MTPTLDKEIDLKLFRAISNHRNYQTKRTVGEKNEDMWYETSQPKSIALVKRLKDIINQREIAIAKHFAFYFGISEEEVIKVLNCIKEKN